MGMEAQWTGIPQCGKNLVMDSAAIEGCERNYIIDLLL